MSSEYHIGQVVPLAPVPPIQLGATEPAWFIFLTPPLKEVAAQTWLAQRGVESWYPSEIRRRRLPKGRRPFVEYQARLVPRYIFARFTGQPQWHALKSCRWLSRVVGLGGCPMPVTDAEMAQMAQVPDRLGEIRRREQEQRIIRPGDKVRIEGGAMEGWIVDVSAVQRGLARLVLPVALFGIVEATAEVSMLRKVSSA